MPTRSDVVRRAFRRLGLAAEDEALTADQMRYAGDELDVLFAEMNTVEGFAFTWTLDDIPEGAVPGLADILAEEIAPHYSVSPTMTRARAIMRLRAWALPDDRDEDDEA